VAEPRAGPHPCARLLAQPNRDLLLDRSAQGLDPNDFDDLDQIQQRLAHFERLYNQIAEPFAWNFTRDKMNAWLARISSHEAKSTQLAA